METFQRVYREVPIEFIVVLHEIKNRERKKRLIKLIFTSRFYNSRVHTDNSNHPRINWSTRQRLFLDSSSFSPLLWFRFFTFFISSISIFAKNNNFPLLFFDVRSTRHSIIHIYFSQFSNTWPKYEIISPPLLSYSLWLEGREMKFGGSFRGWNRVAERCFAAAVSNDTGGHKFAPKEAHQTTKKKWKKRRGVEARSTEKTCTCSRVCQLEMFAIHPTNVTTNPISARKYSNRIPIPNAKRIRTHFPRVKVEIGARLYRLSSRLIIFYFCTKWKL